MASNLSNEMRDEFRKLCGRSVGICVDTHTPLQGTENTQNWLVTGNLMVVGNSYFILVTKKKGNLYIPLEDIYYFSDLSSVPMEENNPAATSKTEKEVLPTDA
jgi:hypothetical protein